MGALSHLQALHFATHDSFAEGQNGQTHQPVEVDSLKSPPRARSNRLLGGLLQLVYRQIRTKRSLLARPRSNILVCHLLSELESLQHGGRDETVAAPYHEKVAWRVAVLQHGTAVVCHFHRYSGYGSRSPACTSCVGSAARTLRGSHLCSPRSYFEDFELNLLKIWALLWTT